MSDSTPSSTTPTIRKGGETVPAPAPKDLTLLNSVMEISIPGFLKVDFTKTFKLEGKVSEGAAGEVYKATVVDSAFKKEHGLSQVAVKLVNGFRQLSPQENDQLFHQELATMW